MAGRRVLVVDGQAVHLALASSFLAGQGLVVRCATSGLTALELLRAERIDLLLTDRCPPGLSGLELLAAARALDPGLPVIVMAAGGSIDEAVAAIKQGACDYLSKPLDLANLLRRLAVLPARRPWVDGNGDGQGASSLPAAVEKLERRMIEAALARAHGVQTRAAAGLGISERVLRYKLRKYTLESSA